MLVNRSLIQKVKGAAVALALVHANTAHGTANTCESFIRRTTTVEEAKQLRDFSQISYESEYTLDEAGPLLRDYAPATSVMRREAWANLSDAERIQFVKTNFAEKPEYAVSSGLEKVANIDFMPQELVVDSTGNLEIILNPPVSTFAQWERIVDTIVNRYGVGSQQAMVSKPRASAFTATTAADIKKHLGWLNFTNLADMFEKLESGHSRFQRDQTKLVAQFFDHPFLGPMTKVKRDVLETYLTANARLERYDDHSNAFVRKRDSSFKYTGGPAYRPDIAGPARWSWEIRNAHKDVEGLKAKVIRDIRAHHSGLEPYKKFADVIAFDTTAEFAKFTPSVQAMLKDVFPSKADPRFHYSREDKLALDTFRNFSLPLMDVTTLVDALAADPVSHATLRLSASRARLSYQNKVHLIEQQLAQEVITKAQAKAQLMGALAEWSVNSGLAAAFDAKIRDIGHDPRVALLKMLMNDLLVA